MYIIQLQYGEYDDYGTAVLGFSHTEDDAKKLVDYYDKRFKYLEELSQKFEDYVFNELQPEYPRPTVDWHNKTQYRTEWKNWTHDVLMSKNEWWNKNLDKPLDKVEKEISYMEQELMTGFSSKLYESSVWHKKIELLDVFELIKI